MELKSSSFYCFSTLAYLDIQVYSSKGNASVVVNGKLVSILPDKDHARLSVNGRNSKKQNQTKEKYTVGFY